MQRSAGIKRESCTRSCETIELNIVEVGPRSVCDQPRGTRDAIAVGVKSVIPAQLSRALSLMNYKAHSMLGILEKASPPWVPLSQSLVRLR